MTRAFRREPVAPGVVDARRCLAWLLQAKGPFPLEFREALGGWIDRSLQAKADESPCLETCSNWVARKANCTPRWPKL